LNKIYFPESGIRKRDLLAYYYRVADHILPFLKDRPLVMRRYPNGIAEKVSSKRRRPNPFQPGFSVPRCIQTKRGGEMDYIMAQDRASFFFSPILAASTTIRGPAAMITRIIPTTSSLIWIPRQTRRSPPCCV